MKQTNHPKKTKSPITWVPTAYFAMGLPFVVLNMVTVLMFKGLGVEDKLITFWTSLILLPWTLKPLWSPFLELFKTKKFFVITTQLITGVTFGLVAFSLNLPHFFSISIALLAIIAFSGATHDIACDGVYMSELSNDDQAKYIGWQGAFYNIAKIIATGGLVYLAGYLIEQYGGTEGADSETNAALDAIWHNNLIPFKNADIFDIAKVLEKVYGVKIILSPDISPSTTYSGVLKRKDSIEDVLRILQNTIYLQYKIHQETIFISSASK